MYVAYPNALTYCCNTHFGIRLVDGLLTGKQGEHGYGVHHDKQNFHIFM